MDELIECALCGEEIEDDEYHELADGRIVCDSCYELETDECGECGERFHEDDLEYWGDDFRLCPDCFKKYFPDFDKDENLKETADAYEAMKRRYIGRKLDENSELDISTDMNEDSFSYSFEITVDKNRVITDISPLSIQRCKSIGITSETWLPYPVSNDDYEEGGTVDSLIECFVEFAEDEKEDYEEDEEETKMEE